MGSYLSGRRDGKRTTDMMRALDVRYLHRTGWLAPGHLFQLGWSRGGREISSIGLQTEADRVTLKYHSQPSEGIGEDMSYPVYLTWTPCSYGGKRVWWLCPVQGCERRVAVLYGGGRVFSCRQCQNLAYRTQHEQAHHRAASRAVTIRQRFDWEPGTFNGGKPKGMHWATYMRLKATYDRLAVISFERIEHKVLFFPGPSRRERRFEKDRR